MSKSASSRHGPLVRCVSGAKIDFNPGMRSEICIMVLSREDSKKTYTLDPV